MNPTAIEEQPAGPEPHAPRRGTLALCTLLLIAASGWGCSPTGRWTRADYHLSYGVSIPI